MIVAQSRRHMVRQLFLYAINGGLVTILYAIVYAALVRGVHAHPQTANLIGFLVAVGSAYLMHSRVTFRAHGDRDRGTQLRFVMASIANLGVNAFWTWLMTDHLHLPALTPLVPICLITPLLFFTINRRWVFR